MSEGSYRRSGAALWHRTSRRAVVLPPGGEVLDLDDTAALVWDALAHPVTASELAGDLAAVFGRRVEEVEADTGPLLDRLVAVGAAVLE